MDLQLTESVVGGLVVVAVQGEVDMHSAPGLSERLTERLAAGRRVIVDLTEVGFIDSTGLGALIEARNRTEPSGAELLVVCAAERILRLLQITGLESVFRVFATVAEAAAAGSSEAVRTTAS